LNQPYNWDHNISFASRNIATDVIMQLDHPRPSTFINQQSFKYQPRTSSPHYRQQDNALATDEHDMAVDLQEYHVSSYTNSLCSVSEYQVAKLDKGEGSSYGYDKQIGKEAIGARPRTTAPYGECYDSIRDSTLRPCGAHLELEPQPTRISDYDHLHVSYRK
jgi:hypothetical protein